MEKISLKIRTTKTSGEIRLRFRLLDGRRADLTHKSDITASLADLKKFEPDGTLKPKISVYNRDLLSSISYEIEVMRQAYRRMTAESVEVNGENFEKMIAAIKTPTATEIPKETLLDRFLRFINEGFANGVFNEPRKRHYMVTHRMLKRFLTITSQANITPKDFKGEDVVKFGQFVGEEYKYAVIKRWAPIYAEMKKGDIPTEPRSQNTVGAKLKMLRALFSELEAGEEIERSPFNTTGRKRIREFLSERANVPIFLTADEFAKILNAPAVPETLIETRKAFLLHCALGCRIGDFQRLTMENVSVSSEGIAYVHYLPEKTKRQSRSNKEIETPLMKFALDIIKETNFNLPVIRYASGKSGYNKKIKDLIEFCGINREVPVYNEEENKNDMVPLHTQASSKLARKTFVDRMAKVQIDLYASGLHSRGSEAVEHYTAMRLSDRFALMNVAFNQPSYKVDKDLNEI